MRFRELLEATQPFMNKLVDPALMTFAEYYELINPGNQYHSEESYDWDLAKMNRDMPFEKPDNYPKLLNRIRLGDHLFEVRLRTDDKWEGKYVKHTPDGNEIVRDEHGMAMYLSGEEVQAMIPETRRWDYTIGVFDEKHQHCARATDEWGALLIVVAQEYRRIGLGRYVQRLARTLMPDKGSGGFTGSGATTFRSTWRSFVRAYLQRGFYSWLVRSGQISMDRVREIVAGLDPSDSERSSRAYDLDSERFRNLYNPEDPPEERERKWMGHVDQVVPKGNYHRIGKPA